MTPVSPSLLVIVIFTLASTAIRPSTTIQFTSPVSKNMWWEGGKKIGLLIQHCFQSSPSSSSDMFVALQECFKRKTMKAIERALTMDVIDIYDGIQFVRQRWSSNTARDIKALQVYKYSSNNNETVAEEWKSRMSRRLFQLFDTHVLKIPLKSLDDAVTEVEGRGRRKNNMFTHLMMFGLIAASFIVIPMGFQFLAILGGKALLLAKMALLLSSIQGLKKIATSNYNYGLYSYGGGPCKDSFGYGCGERLNGGYYDDANGFFDTTDHIGDEYGDGDVALSVHIDGATGNYDRQWPYNPDGYGAGYGNYDGRTEGLNPRRER